MNPKSVRSILEDVFDILGGYGFASMDKAAAELELKPGWSTWLFAIWLFGKEPITVTNFMRMFPYGLARLNEERFASAVQHGYLVSDEQHGYLPTESGMKAAQRVWRAAGDSLTSLNLMPETQFRRIFEYLARLGVSAMSAPEPPPHYFMSHKRENYQHLEVVYPLERFVVLFGELSAYRDDCYISTWTAHRVEGHAWDALDLFSRVDSLTFSGLHEHLSKRGITEDVHLADVNELIRRGWVDEDAGAYMITSAGKQVRADVEAETERLFFLPWSWLNISELEDFARLTVDLHNGLGLIQENR